MNDVTRNEIKSYMALKGVKMVELIEKLKAYGIETTPQALSNKLSRDTIRYSEVKAIADILGYKINWIDTEKES